MGSEFYGSELWERRGRYIRSIFTAWNNAFANEFAPTEAQATRKKGTTQNLWERIHPRRGRDRQHMFSA
jgi:hypothetical protein